MGNLKPSKNNRILKTLTYVGDFHTSRIYRDNHKFIIQQELTHPDFEEQRSIYLDEESIQFMIDSLIEIRNDYKKELKK